MPFKTLQSAYPKDDDLPLRAFRLSALRRVIDGTLYDELPHPFHTEKSDAGEYVPLRDRRPSVRYALCRLVVDDSVSMLFSEGHFPGVDCEDEATKDALVQVIKESALNEVMIDAATRGSVGSVAVMFRVIEGRVFFEVMETEYLTPTWNPKAPDKLLMVTERYKVKGKTLAAAGYPINGDDLQTDYWFQRIWDASAETWFVPQKITEAKAPSVDTGRTVTHPLGFVPVVWVRNLPGGDKIDGACTYPPEAIDANIEIDYLLSQGGRGLKYSADPTLLIKEPATGSDGSMIRGAGNAITVGPDGDAKMLEINGTATQALMDYVRMVRELALESAHGNRANADKISAAQSGRAQEMLNQSLIWLADKLRISYGEGALLSLLTMVVTASEKISLTFKDGSKAGKLAKDKTLALRWPAWYAATASDRQSEATTLNTLKNAGVISQETAVKTIAPEYDIEDPAAEIVRIGQDRTTELELLAATTAATSQVKVQE
ncbi:phage portal protein [Glaciimonas sp. PCH181]|uniref:phage portal protein n=1 Tax=Glaciimonas sp. PCH181 TaxID=2133943 RepID=UPI000D3514A1|nr:phage portal protein [Glaciimonas sp. PCH181]PUA19594.1 hypothetical protein C7W93_07040 [Glaciimonas sp. PCH181]